MRELFIYYRLSAVDAPAAQAAVVRFQAQLRQAYPGLTARLLRRPDEADGQKTWMEIYAGDPVRQPSGVDGDMQRAIEAHASVLRPWLASPRHTEVFVPVA